MAVAKNDSGTNNKNSGGSFGTSIDSSTTGFTVSTGSNLYLVGILGTGRANITSPAATWNSVSMTNVVSKQASANEATTTLFGLVNPATGNLLLSCSWTGSIDAVLGMIAMSGVDQTTPVVTANNQTASGTGASGSVTITSAANDLTLAALTNGSGAAQTVSITTQTSLYANNGQSDCQAGASYALGGSSNTHTFGITGSSGWAIVGVHVQQVQSALSPNVNINTLTQLNYPTSGPLKTLQIALNIGKL